jgi:prepilin-type processing-associated H-X9-DG protein
VASRFDNLVEAHIQVAVKSSGSLGAGSSPLYYESRQPYARRHQAPDGQHRQRVRFGRKRQGPSSWAGAIRPAESAPRTYLINGFNDYYRHIVGKDGMTNLRRLGNNEIVIKESNIPEPSGTIAFGERDNRPGAAPQYHMDFDMLDDLTGLNQSMHSNSARTGRGGGSNYSMVDGHVEFLRYGKTFNPINLWAVSPEERNVAISSP